MNSAQLRVWQAQAELAAAERALDKNSDSLRTIFRKHRVGFIVGGGFVSGLTLTLLPARWWSRIGSVLGSTAAHVARSSLMPIVIGAAMSQLRSAEKVSPEGAAPAQ